MRSLLKVLGTLVAIGIFVYFLYGVAAVLERYDLRVLLSPRLFLATSVLTLCYGTIIPISAWAWVGLLKTMGKACDASRLTAILAISQIGKYLPGNVAQIATRSALAMVHRVPGRALLFSLGAEAVLAVVASIVVGGLGFALSRWHPPLPGGFGMPWLAAGAMVALFLVGSVGFWKGFGPWARQERRLVAQIVGCRQALALAFIAYSFNYLLIGLGLWIVAQSLEGISADYWYLTSTFALAWALGFLTPGAPAGLGVREGTMMFLLAGVGTDAANLVLIAAARAATVIADALWAAVGLVYFRVAGIKRT